METGVHATQPQSKLWGGVCFLQEVLEGCSGPPDPSPQLTAGRDEPQVASHRRYQMKDVSKSSSAGAWPVRTLTSDGTPMLEASRKGRSWSWEPLAAHTLVTNQLENPSIEGPRCPVAVAGAAALRAEEQQKSGQPSRQRLSGT